MGEPVKDIFCINPNGKKYGPMLAVEIQDLIDRRLICPDTIIVRGDKQWIAKDLKSLKFKTFGQRVKTRIIQLIAMVVIFGICSFVYNNAAASTLLISVVLSIAFTIFVIWGILKIIKNQEAILEQQRKNQP